MENQIIINIFETFFEKKRIFDWKIHKKRHEEMIFL